MNKLAGFLVPFRFVCRVSWSANRTLTIVVVISTLVAGLGLPAAAITSALLAQQMLAGDSLTAGVGLLSGILFVTGLGMWLHSRLVTSLGEQLAFELDVQITRGHLAFVDLDDVSDPKYTSRLAVLQDNRDQFGEAVALVATTASIAFQLILTVGLLGIVEPILLVVPIGAAISAVLVRRADRQLLQAYVETAAHTRLTQHLFEIGTSVDAGKEIRTFDLRQAIPDLYRSVWQEQDTVFHRARMRGSLAHSFAVLVQAAFVLLGIWLAVSNAQSSQQVTNLVLALFLLTPALTTAARAGTLVLGGSNLLQLLQLAAVLDQHARTRQAKAGSLVGVVPPVDVSRELQAEGGLSLHDVGYQYPGSDTSALKSVNLHIPDGAIVAVVGPNGAGKSTLVELIAGLRRPTEGRIERFGREMDPHARRLERSSSAVWQDFARVEFSLRESVRIGDEADPTASERVPSALELAQAGHLATELPDGLDSQIGRSLRGGTDLSTGQWQRVATARALVRKDADLLVLDEPTASLDPLKERAFLDIGLRAARHETASNACITVFVSHRLAAAPLADLVIYMEKGSVREFGTHVELMREGGAYTAMFTLQSGGYLDSAKGEGK